MRYMRRRGLKMFAVAALLPMMALAQNNAKTAKPAGPQDATTQQVTQLVRDFLANVPKNDPKVFQEFFADDVIYTRGDRLDRFEGGHPQEHRCPRDERSADDL